MVDTSKKTPNFSTLKLREPVCGPIFTSSGWHVNVKRVYRIYREEGLNLRRKRPRRRVAPAHRSVRPEISKRGKSSIVTHVERESRYLLAGKLDDRTAAQFTANTVRMLGNVIRQSLRKILTIDNGSEGAKFKEIGKGTDLAVYFAKLYAAWQRGTNENTNCLLR